MKNDKQEDMCKEYKREDLGKGVRGKYLKDYKKGTNLVLLSPDVAAAFPNDIAVNEALRSLLKVAQQSIAGTKRTGRPKKPSAVKPHIQRQKERA